jgi:hypothetical protein
MKTFALVLAFWLSFPAFAGASGRVIRESGAPVIGADVCEMADQNPEVCVRTDENGAYRIDSTTKPKLFIRARGFVSTTVDAAPLTEPVKLQAAATILVTVVDAKTGAPLPKGSVMIDIPSGYRVGTEAPFNKAGVRISTLAPGLVFVRANAPGYAPGGPLPVELVAGSEKAVTVKMTKTHSAPH